MNKRLLFISAFCCLIPGSSFSQGILPPKKEAPHAGQPANPYLIIGDVFPKSLTVTDANGKTQTLLSHKVATEALVLGFFSPRCAQNQQQWRQLKRFYEAYKGWHAGFIAVSVNPDENLEELAQTMSKAGLPYSVVRDDQGRLARVLHVTATPEIVILDEFDTLRYRGPLKYASKALDAIIGQEEMHVDPEPADLEGCAIQ